jgi:hypothetical protein
VAHRGAQTVLQLGEASVERGQGLEPVQVSSPLSQRCPVQRPSHLRRAGLQKVRAALYRFQQVGKVLALSRQRSRVHVDRSKG